MYEHQKYLPDFNRIIENKQYKNMENRESLDIDINKYLLMFKRQWKTGAIIFLTTVGLSIAATRFIKPAYEASGKILFRTPTFKIVEGQDGGELKTVGGNNPINNQIELILSARFLEKVIDKLNVNDNDIKNLSLDKLQRNVKLKIVAGTDILKVSYSSGHAEETASVVNAILDVYLENEVLNNTSEAVTTRDFLIKQLPKNRTEVNLAQSELRQFKQENNIVNIEEEMKFMSANTNSLDNEINAIKVQLEELKAQSEILNKQIGITAAKGMTVSNINQSAAVQEILKSLQAVEIQLATEKGRFVDDNPVIITLEEKRKNLQGILQQQINQTTGEQVTLDAQPLQIGQLRQGLIQNLLQNQVQYSGLSQKLETLYKIRNNYQIRIKKLPKLEQKQHDLERKLLLAETSYQTILKQIQDLQLAVNKNTANARIIAQAVVPKKPDSSKKFLLILLGIMFGIFFSSTAILLIELQDKYLKTIQEIQDRLPYTLLGNLPIIPKKSSKKNLDPELVYADVIVLNAPRSEISELYRMIQTNLKFISSDKVLKTVVITSAVPQEGKSTIAANLAATMAQLGRKVLLIDGDMRIPVQQKIWNINRVPGLSDVLIGEAQMEDAIWTVFKNLDVLPTGAKVPNPLALIDSTRMATIMNELRSLYDFIIIDSPPFLLAADALTLGQISDGMILVCRPGVLDYNSAAKAKDILKRSDKNIVGLVVNGIIAHNEPNNYLLNNYYFMDEDVIDKKKVRKI